MQSQQKVRTGDLEISGQGNRSTAKRYSIIQLRPTQHDDEQHVHRGVDGQITAFLVRVWRASRSCKPISEAMEAISVPMPPRLVPMISSRHWSQKPDSSNRGRHVADELAGRRRPLPADAPPTSERGQLVEFGHALHVADEDEEHAERERQSPIDVCGTRGGRMSRNATNTMTHINHSGIKSLTASKQTTNNSRVYDRTPAAITGTVAGHANLVRLRPVGMRGEHVLFRCRNHRSRKIRKPVCCRKSRR